MIGLFPTDTRLAWVIDIAASNISKKKKGWSFGVLEKLSWIGTKG